MPLQLPLPQPEQEPSTEQGTCPSTCREGSDPHVVGVMAQAGSVSQVIGVGLCVPLCTCVCLCMWESTCIHVL